MKRILLIIAIVVVILVVGGLAAVFFSLNTIVKKGVETVGPQVVKVDVKLDSADISPFSGSGALKKFVVANPSNFKSPSAFQFDDVKLGVVVPSVWSQVIVINEINIQGAQVTLEGSLAENNLLDIYNNVKGQPAAGSAAPAQPAKTEPAPAGPSKSSKQFCVKDFVLAGTKLNIDVTLPQVGRYTKTITIPDIHVQNIGSPDKGVTVEQLVETVLGPLKDAAIKAAEDEATKAGTAELKKDAGKALQNGLNDLLKKK